MTEILQQGEDLNGHMFFKTSTDLYNEVQSASKGTHFLHVLENLLNSQV